MAARAPVARADRREVVVVTPSNPVVQLAGGPTETPARAVAELILDGFKVVLVAREERQMVAAAIPLNLEVPPAGEQRVAIQIQAPTAERHKAAPQGRRFPARSLETLVPGYLLPPN